MSTPSSRPLASTACVAMRRLPWADPLAAARPFADEPWALSLLSDGGPHGRWSYLMRSPEAVATAGPGDDPTRLLRGLLGPAVAPSEGPPFTGGVVGLAAYELGARFGPPALPRDLDWPDLTLARYRAVLAFDHAAGVVLALGRGATPEAAESASAEAAGWLGQTAERDCPREPLAESLEAEAPPETYEAQVAQVVARIAAGEIFQANIARGWRGRLHPGRTPFEAFCRLAGFSEAPYAAFWRLPSRALVSNSPERFLGLDAASRVLTAQPIKGTRARHSEPASDAALGRELIASAKDRAENLMIVDLMRNDLARVCEPGSVRVTRLCELETYPNVHHLVSAIEGRAAPANDAAAVLAATFPPGSITGAPKVQAMKVIAGMEPPRGPWCGSLFLAGFDGGLEASVLIRTAGFVEDEAGWRFRTCAGAGIVADSDPVSERLETDVKLSALRRALTGRLEDLV